MNRRTLIAGLGLGMTMSALPAGQALAAGLTDRKKRVFDLLKSIETGDRRAASAIDPHHYTQHNPMVADGLVGFQAMLAHIPPGATTVNTVRVFRDGDFVFAHSEYGSAQPAIGFDIFRFERGLIVEHWDNLQLRPNRPNPSGRTMIDGATAATGGHAAANKAVVRGFVEEVLTRRRMSAVSDYIDPVTYLQHNPHVGDGADAMVAAFAKLDAAGTPHRYRATPMILGEGDFVLAASEGTIGDTPTAYYDLFRVSHGRIVEHWDVVATIPPRADWKNANGKF